MYQAEFASLQKGNYSIQLSSTAAMAEVSIKVASRAPAGADPLTAECWTSAGRRDVDLQAGDLLVVLGEARQGQRPVVGARVVALVDRDDGRAPVELVLQDTGAGADRTAGDGLYTSYFTHFLQSNDDRRYKVSCRVEGTEETRVLQDSTTRGLPSLPSREHPVCCGTTTLRDDSTLLPTGTFTRTTPGGLISVKKTGDISNIFPPGRVTDLSIWHLDFSAEEFSLRFTFPGSDLDQGTVAAYKMFYTTNRTVVGGQGDLVEGGQVLLLTGEQQACNCSLPAPAPSHTLATLELSMASFPREKVIHWRLRVEDQGGKWSLSNIASTFLTALPADSSAAALTTMITMAYLPFILILGV